MTHTESGSEGRRPGAVYMSLLLVTADRIDLEKAAHEHLRLDPGAEYKDLIDKRYACAYDFVFNAFLSESCMTHHYLGRQTDLGDDLPALGRSRVDCVHQTNRYHRTRSLHLHFSFEHGEFDIRDPDPEKVTALAALGRRLWGSGTVEHLPKRLSEFVGTVTKDAPRKMAFDLSRYVYVSVCGQDFDGDWEPFADTLWALLFFQDAGANADEVRKRLNDASWAIGGTFFRNFFHSGGMVTLSAPYPPELYAAHREWFLPPFNAPEQPLGPAADPADEEYDHLPEFPPLRYVAFPLLEYAGWVEETLRDSSSSLLRANESPIGPWAVRRMRGFGSWLRLLWRLPSIQNGVYRVQNLDVLKLPVTRPFAEALVKDKQLDVTREACRDLQAGALSLIVLVLTVIGLLIAVIQLVPVVRDSLAVQTGWLP